MSWPKISTSAAEGALWSAKEAAVFFARKLSGLSREELWIVGLDDARRGLGLVRVAVGDCDGVQVVPSRLVSLARGTGCEAFFLAHNHPSGDPMPSLLDWVATRTAIDAADRADLELVDHLIIGDGVYASLRAMNEPMFAGVP